MFDRWDEPEDENPGYDCPECEEKEKTLEYARGFLEGVLMHLYDDFKEGYDKNTMMTLEE